VSWKDPFSVVQEVVPGFGSDQSQRSRPLIRTVAPDFGMGEFVILTLRDLAAGSRPVVLSMTSSGRMSLRKQSLIPSFAFAFHEHPFLLVQSLPVPVLNKLELRLTS
jgi:hypothetical protein